MNKAEVAEDDVIIENISEVWEGVKSIFDVSVVVIPGCMYDIHCMYMRGCERVYVYVRSIVRTLRWSDFHKRITPGLQLIDY